MEDLYIRPFLKSHKTHTEGSQLQKNASLPDISEYQNMTEKYKNYLNNLNNKIDKICEKERQRTLFKERKLKNIKSELQKKKNSLESELAEKLDPNKSENGKLYQEITALKKLEYSYK